MYQMMRTAATNTATIPITTQFNTNQFVANRGRDWSEATPIPER